MKSTSPLSHFSQKSAQAVCLGALFCLASQSYGAPVYVDSVTYDGSYDLTSVTIGATTYNSDALTGSTARTVTSATGSAYTGFWIEDTLPELTNLQADLDGASSGLNVRAAATGLKTGSIFQFGKTIAATDNIFILEFGNGDPMGLQLIDSDDNTVGTYTISLDTDDFGLNIVNFDGIDTLTLDNTVSNLAGVKAQQGTSFKLSDFSGSGGDLSTVTGLRITSGAGIDPSVIGLASIPEPNAFALLAGLAALTAIATRRRA